MVTNALGTDIVTQVAIVVRDVEKASAAWARMLGVDVPSWKATDMADVSHVRYGGETTPARAKLAFFRLGQVSLELIEPIDAPSTWNDFLEAHGDGIHHIAFQVQGMEVVLDNLAQQDVTLVQRGDCAGGRYAYVDGQSTLGAVLELLENLPAD